MNGRIVIIGSCNVDMVIKTVRLPLPGETVLGGSFIMNPGGKGANQAVAAARMNGKVTFISKTGNDILRDQATCLYKEAGINIKHILSDSNNPTGVALITVDNYGENCIVVAPGANACLNSQDIDSVKDLIESAEVLLMQLEIPVKTVEYAAEVAFNKGVKVVLNPAPATKISNELLQQLYAIIPNATEAEALSGVKVNDWSTARIAADRISGMGVGIVIITMGEEGAFIKEHEDYHIVSTEKIDAVDTTAAGDTFCGTFCVGITEGLTVIEAVKMANKASGITVTREGAQNSIPYRKEIQN